ncbi:calcium-binding protein [Yersinia rochesterensis]|uniref:calcium-binding protein n=1 Tax=Yersinia rochesterensis TaxID=1604335 RepID=UPI00285342AE|nr:calcium-binding protein [Yersinia rochesterensis]MDR5019918.1 calcium-binding protein [Yersinia rochesterensis]
MQKHTKKSNSRKTPLLGELIQNGNSESIFIDYISPEKIFFEYSDSTLTIKFRDKNGDIYAIKKHNVIKDGQFLIKSIMIRDKEGVKHELFLTLTKTHKRENFYDGPDKDLLLTREDLPNYSAHHLITNTPPSKETTLKDNDSFVGHKYMRNVVTGGKGDNIIQGGDKNDNLGGGTGNDIIYGHASFDALFGQEGDDILIGGEGNDGLAGGAGNDILDGGDGNDELHGDADAFACFASESSWRGNDIIFGGKGNDRIEGQKNNDYLAGGTGNDLYVFSAYDGINMIVEYSGEENTISIDDYFFHQLKLNRYGNHLMISSTEEHPNNLVIVIKDQYSEDGYKVKNLQTKSYLSHGSESDKKIHAVMINNIVKKYNGDSEKLMAALSKIKDFGDSYQTELSDVFCEKTPDFEQITRGNLTNVLIEKNNALREMYEEKSFYFGDNLPDITYITQALSSFAPKEAYQSNIKYLKSPIPMDSFSGGLVTVEY